MQWEGTCLFNFKELYKQMIRNRPAEYIKVLLNSSFMRALWQDTMTHLNPPTYGNLCRRLAQFLSNHLYCWIRKNIPFDKYCTWWTQRRKCLWEGPFGVMITWKIVINKKQWQENSSNNSLSTHSEVNAFWLTEFAKLGLLPNRVTFHLVNSRRNSCCCKQILQLLGTEVTYTNASCLTRLV